jgi:hypothetical protein
MKKKLKCAGEGAQKWGFYANSIMERNFRAVYSCSGRAEGKI